MGAYTSEWLVVDQRGAFAMGTFDGIRTRKYHGLFMGVAGRSQTAFLVDMDVEANGKPIWPHCYRGPEGSIFYPSPDEVKMKLSTKNQYPEWQWNLAQGKLSLKLEPNHPGGIAFVWNWTSRTQAPIQLKIRKFWGMRDLHSLGGAFWTWNETKFDAENNSIQGVVVGNQGQEAHCLLKGNWIWVEDSKWFHNFHYIEEIERGYDANENLYSAGFFEIQIQHQQSAAWVIAEDANDLTENTTCRPYSKYKTRDFMLTRPAGIIAGYPWFGEWGRDTFISLPGIVAEQLKAGQNPDQLWAWSRELLYRWGEWIDRNGMLPNLLEKKGQCQWESADATLWWCHSLASLWALSLCPPFPFEGLQLEFSELLNRTIRFIQQGRHRFLTVNQNGIIEVYGNHSTWMDAQVDGFPVTPRQGVLPEINALWFQAKCLQLLWSQSEDVSELEALGLRVLNECHEPGRPNRIFMHSLTLAPSFVLKKWADLERDLFEIAEQLWTPVGLRSLAPTHPHFRAHCVGTQRQRDYAYHQGTVWGWLGGHFEMARHRWVAQYSGSSPAEKFRVQKQLEQFQFDKMFIPEVLKDMPIQGHIPEIFDAEPPFTPRGTPAQAWSIACVEESKAYKRNKVDSKISKILAQRWLGRMERKKKQIHPDDSVGVAG